MSYDRFKILFDSHHERHSDRHVHRTFPRNRDDTSGFTLNEYFFNFESLSRWSMF